MNISINHTRETLGTPYKPVYIINPEQHGRAPSHAGIAIRLTTKTQTNFYAVFDQFRNRVNNFVVLVDQEEWSVEIQEALLHCLFSPNYLFIGNKPVIMIQSARHARYHEITEFTRSLKNILALQGYHDIVEWETDGAQIRSSELLQPLLVTAAINTDAAWVKEQLLKDFKSATSYVVFKFETIADATTTERSINIACEKYLENDTLLLKGLRDYIALEETTRLLKSQNQNLQQQIESAEKTIGVIRTKYKDDYENLFKWYHNEYEILPTWYKRFGHILKVIMGKRSFRSLFSDDVKKYKS